MDPYEAVSTDSELEDSDDDSIADPDFVGVSDHDTGNEQESMNEDDGDTNENEVVVEKPAGTNRNMYFFGKDGTKWGKVTPPRNVSILQENLVSHLPGVLGEARDALFPIQYWIHMFGNCIDIIAKNTNLYIEKISDKYQDKNECKPTDPEEIPALLGLLYLVGLHNGSRTNLEEYWSSDFMRYEIFPATMAKRRFAFLLRCIRFDDTMTRDQRKAADKLAAVRTIVDIFNGNCKKCYSVSQFVTLDETLLAFRGRWIFRMYIPNKPNKYRLKVFSVVDAKTI